jgi:predicted metal-dependent HD superfamily phosphohydrolase
MATPTTSEHVVLRSRWMSARSGPIAEAVIADLLSRWSSPGRAYHNVEHLRECLDELDAVTAAACEAVDIRPISLALWFHDAIYDPTRSDNESASAELAAAQLARLGESPETIAAVRRLVLDTAHRSQPATPDGRLIVDIDLAILGKPAERFDRYDAAIRAEYAHVSEADYRAGRAKVLQSFLDRSAIYTTPVFGARYETAARENLRRAVSRLAQV